MEKNSSILQEAKQLSAVISSTLPDRIQIDALTMKSKLPFKALSIRELSGHRVAQLSASAVDLFEQKQYISAAILTRAILETVAVLYSAHIRLDQFFNDKNVTNLDNYLMRYQLGSRNQPELPEAINILTLVDRVNKTIPNFRNVYDSLCEYAHPNWAGTLGAFGEIEHDTFELKLGPSERTNVFSISISALSGALFTFIEYYDATGAQVQKLNDYFESGRCS